MKEVETFRWYMPAPAWKGPRAKSYLTSYHMTVDEARARGAIEAERSSRQLRRVPETAEDLRHTDTSAVQRRT